MVKYGVLRVCLMLPLSCKEFYIWDIRAANKDDDINLLQARKDRN